MTVKNVFNGETYDLDKVAASLRNKGIESSAQYQQSKSLLIDQTMSCDMEEALSHLVGVARRVLSLAGGKKNDSLRAEFLSAYDLAKHLNPKVFA